MIYFDFIQLKCCCLLQSYDRIKVENLIFLCFLHVISYIRWNTQLYYEFEDNSHDDPHGR